MNTCQFPLCPEETDSSTMCVLHAHVHVSDTGSWLSDPEQEDEDA